MQGATVLVIEEEYLIAADIEQTLRSAGAVAVEVFHNVDELRAQHVRADRFDLAVIEAKLGHPDVISFARDLRQAGVAVVVTSADSGIQILFEGAVGLDKPFDTQNLLAACMAARGTAMPFSTELS